jgi:energy-coupling factor transporter ATP-binding protein EcfA2
MKYNYIELSGYKRMALNHINRIRITPENKIQLILGSNGSGKSSLLKEISPLPANHKEFLDGGYKLVSITHNNSEYILKNTFDKAAGHEFSFLKDGVELNPGLTMSTFKELVKKEFRITAEVHELMTGQTRFHLMSTAERRSWITTISDVDYSYALAYYKRLGEQHRDLTGAIKLTQSRLVQESEKLLSKEDEEKTIEEIKTLQGYMSSLYDKRKNVSATDSALSQEMTSMLSNMYLSAHLLIKLCRDFQKNDYVSMEEIDQEIITASSKVSGYELHIRHIADRIEHHEHLIRSLQETNVSSLADVVKSIDVLKGDIAALENQKVLKLTIPLANEASSVLAVVRNTLTDVLKNLAPNEDGKYSREAIQAAMEKEAGLKLEVEALMKKLQQSELHKKELEHFKLHSRQECPNCNHVWHKGYNEGTYNHVMRDITVASERLKTATEELEKVSQYVAKAREYSASYTAYRSAVRAYPILEPMWDRILHDGTIFSNPPQVLRLMDDMGRDLEVQVQIEQKEKTLKETTALRDVLTKDQATSKEQLEKEAEKLNIELYRASTLSKVARLEVSRHTAAKKIAKEIVALQSELQISIDEMSDKQVEHVSAMMNHAILDIMHVIRDEITQRERLISKISIQKALVADLDTQHNEMTEKATVLKLALDELSPTKGLIAKGLTSFINPFVKQINNFIKKIWVYPLELIPIVPDEDDDVTLDYKFSVRINDDSVIPDVIKASSGMKEIIDLAFMVVSLPYLGLQDAPLYLDEFGNALDEEHRHIAHNVVTGLLTTTNFSQIFLISHYENSYGSLKNADVTVLHPANIRIPKDIVYNKHTVIT